jgi:intracellular sulfur oxidation DsrE/DsrF family protein
MSKDRISEERLNAFIDDELGVTEKSEVFEALGNDSSLSQQACELRQLSELLRHAYERPPAIETYRKAEPSRSGPWGRAAAASLLLGLGASLGWVSHHQPEPSVAASATPNLNAMYWDDHRAFQNTDLNAVADQRGPKRIIVHLNTSSTDKFEKALATAEQLLETYSDPAMDSEIEVVANASAIRMLRTGYSPYSDRVRQLQDRYFNLTFLACKDAIDHIRELEGPDTDVSLLPDVETTPSALEHILERLSEGWVYINV